MLGLSYQPGNQILRQKWGIAGYGTEPVAGAMLQGAVKAGQWATKAGPTVTENGVTEAAIFIQMAVGVDTETLQLPFQAGDDMFDQCPVMEQRQALVLTLHATGATSGQDDTRN